MMQLRRKAGRIDDVARPLGHNNYIITDAQGVEGGSRLATKIFQIMLLNEAETSTELN